MSTRRKTTPAPQKDTLFILETPTYENSIPYERDRATMIATDTDRAATIEISLKNARAELKLVNEQVVQMQRGAAKSYLLGARGVDFGAINLRDRAQRLADIVAGFEDAYPDLAARVG
jgi:hypothetical protein